ncbi:MAG: Fe-S protein assembly co-chaperone HscB [Gemmataceae bacterium]|nr:Fe-S protein assembly co-chaperone HscB [Gemmataceae bacterium]
MNYFELLSLERAYKIDLVNLEVSYLAASKKYHPDFLNSAIFDADALKLSAMVNQAYSTLKDPFQRAEYLLKLEDGKNSEEIRTVPPDILEEVMDIRFELESQAKNVETLEQLKKKLTSRLNYFEDRLLILFEHLKCLMREDREKVLLELRLCLNSSKYFLNILSEIDD